MTDPLLFTTQRDLYLLRGEAVSIAGQVEWCIARLAAAFAGCTETDTGRQWEAVKKSLQRRGLQSALQRELAAVKGYFDPRNLAAHAAFVITETPGVHGSVQLFRLAGKHNQATVEEVTLDILGAERDRLRGAFAAVQTIGRALDDNDPDALAKWNSRSRPFLLGTD